ncbi:MAG: hypothetical protein K9L30_05440 [Desulfobacterales bacterium]|nr:hypothetical protein [Desulfobacterales bacterium]
MKIIRIRKMAGITLFFSLLLLLCVQGALADTLKLKDGSLINGEFIGGTRNSIRFHNGDNVKYYNKVDVLSVSFDSPEQNTPPALHYSSGSGIKTQGDIYLNVSTDIRLLVRLDESIDSRSHSVGHRFAGHLETDLLKKNEIVAPKGSKVFGIISDLKDTVYNYEVPYISLIIIEIIVDDISRPVATKPFKVVADKINSDAAHYLADGALVGTIADGSEGAETGAKIGLAMTMFHKHGRYVYIPSGGLLSFKILK